MDVAAAVFDAAIEAYAAGSVVGLSPCRISTGYCCFYQLFTKKGL